MPSFQITPPVDCVVGDVAALATHMRHCARSRGAMFGVRNALQVGGTVAASRIVTVACLGLGVAFAVFAMA
ncbi:hypothetical protein WKW80_02065 [Variovorax humicola]|uniref:Uncharacterized protein n=1 Tax=Variovorax humicola TaxID=1769758 RepID=A0ABU8VU86_9BURK